MEVGFGDDTQVCHDFYVKFHITETLLDEISRNEFRSPNRGKIHKSTKNY